MTAATLEQIAGLLSEVGAHGTFTARRTAAADDLDLEVKGVGRLRFPVSRAQAQQLRRIARPASYGQGEETLLDRRVRDTGEIPKSRVKIDRRRWKRTLLPVLDALRADLGLPDGSRLTAELHAMLVYAPGQFFLPHQDSEKADEMVGTLVVTLPSPFKGGALVVEHRDEKVTHRGHKERLSFVAFYADCRHQVRPVTEGYRIVLTYNLILAGDGTAAAAAAPATIDALAERLREHFATPLPPRSSWPKDAPPRDPPGRLVYLLDHQYTERGLGWHRLKGGDAARVAVLRAAAERADCEVVLALAEVQETWGCMEPGWDEDWYRGRHRHWARDEDEEWLADDEPPAVDDPEAYQLTDLQDSTITLDRWIDPSGKAAEPIVTSVDGEEVCSTTPSASLKPYASEYEGYMGNWGNTMDRWYRRGALVVWPREGAFAVRAEASPSWALETLDRRIRTGALTEAREMSASLAPFWVDVVGREERRGRLFADALRVAASLDRKALAAALLQPFRVEELTAAAAPAFVALVGRYGESWTRSLLSAWSDPDRRWMWLEGPDRLARLVSLPNLCQALRAADGAVGTAAARLLLEDSWAWLEEAIEERRGIAPPSRREAALKELPGPILGILGSTAVVEAGDLRDEVVTSLSADENEPLVPYLVRILRAAAAESAPPAVRAALGLDAIARHCTRSLEARLALPARRGDDWSIAPPPGCSCKLCGTLGAFLADPDEQRLEWPLAKEGRKHVHRRLDDHELPVRHETRRSGRPFTLVLTKTAALFERETRERRSRQADLAWLAQRSSVGGHRRRRGEHL